MAIVAVETSKIVSSKKGIIIFSFKYDDATMEFDSFSIVNTSPESFRLSGELFSGLSFTVNIGAKVSKVSDFSAVKMKITKDVKGVIQDPFSSFLRVA